MKAANKELSAPRHPLFQIGEQVEQQGLMVIDNITSMPIYGEAYISPFALAVLCQQGSVRAEYDMQPVEFHPGDFCQLRVGHVVKAYETSADYRARAVVMSQEFIRNFKQSNAHYFEASITYYDSHPNIHLTDGQCRQMNDAFNLLQTCAAVGRRYREEMVQSVFRTLLMLRSEFCPVPADATEEHPRQLAALFRRAVVEHYRESREVAFYARMFCLSPKYFSTLIKQDTGISASEWIDRYLVLQAKDMLSRRRDLTIQQVSDLLGFSEQASFSRFFKKQTGLSPTEFREQG